MPRRTKDDPVARAFGAALKAERQRREMTLETVAGRIPRTGRDGGPTTMDAKYLQSMEQGYHSPTITTALQIARAMDAELADLVRDL